MIRSNTLNFVGKSKTIIFKNRDNSQFLLELILKLLSDANFSKIVFITFAFGLSLCKYPDIFHIFIL